MEKTQKILILQDFLSLWKLVEATGVEPVSENLFTELSTSVVGRLAYSRKGRETDLAARQSELVINGFPAPPDDVHC